MAPTAQTHLNILWVSADAGSGVTMRNLMQHTGHTVHCPPTSVEAFGELCQRKCDVCVCDLPANEAAVYEKQAKVVDVPCVIVPQEPSTSSKYFGMFSRIVDAYYKRKRP